MQRQNSKKGLTRQPSVNKSKNQVNSINQVNKSSNSPVIIVKKGRDGVSKSNSNNDINFNNINNLNIKRPFKVSESSFVSNVRPSTPSKIKTSISYRKNRNYTKDQAAKVIQRKFRIYIHKIKNDPKFQMAYMLKKKKMKILKSYKILDTTDFNKDIVIDDESINISKDGNKVTKNAIVSRKSTLVDEEDKVTGNFSTFDKMNNVKNVYEILNPNKQMESEEKDNFIDDYESFLSYEKKNINVKNANDESYYKKDIKDDNLDRLKHSLDNYARSIKEEDKVQDKGENFKLTKNDLSDTVNVYEKIFQDINNKNHKNNSNSNTDIYPNPNNINENHDIQSTNNIYALDFSEENINTPDKHVNNYLINNTNINTSQIDGSKMRVSEYSDIEYYGNKGSISNNSKIPTKLPNETETNFLLNQVNLKSPVNIETTPHNFSIDNSKRIQRLTSLLETEEIKSEINSSLRDQNKSVSKNKINEIHSILDQESIMSNFKNKPDRNIDRSYGKINSAEVLNMALELKESKKTIDTMKEIIEELKKQSKQREEEMKKDFEEKLKSQNFEYENTLQRQKGLIEGLLAEKKKQSSLIDELTEKLDSVDKISHKKISSLVENFDVELKKNKDAWFQAEKMRRKKWEDQKMKEIKESTVKGLEPEIERILNSHKAEMSKMEDRLHEDLRRQRDKINADWEKRMQEIKDRFAKEKEEALEHERSLNNQRLRNQNERLEEEYNEERRRWNAHFTAELERLESLREKDKKIYEDQLTKIESRNNLSTEERENFYKSKLNEIEKRSEEKSKDIEESLKIKFQREKEKFIVDKNKEFEIKIKDAKNDLLRDRDKQIQIIIEKLGDETIQERKKILVECERKADEINKSLKIENENMKNEINKLSDKLNAESKVRNILDENLDLLTRQLQEKEKDSSKKEKQLLEINSNYNDLNLKYSNILKDFNKEKLDMELEYKARLQKTESDFKLLMDKLDQVKNYYESKISDIQNLHKNEVMDIEEKIKKTLARKDDFVKKLQEESALKDLSIQKYEELLAKQRKELLFNNK